MAPRPMPMFPLGTVLFPYAVLPLRVFEPRYRVMTRRCLDGDREFGVVLIERGSEVGGGDVRFGVGTIARIVQVAETPDGGYSEQHRGAELAGLVLRGLEDAQVVILQHDAVDLVLDRLQLAGADGCRMREVEAQALRPHGRAGLLDVLAELVAQGALQQVRGGVVGHRRPPALGVDARVHDVAGAQLAVQPHEQRLIAVEAVDRLDLAAHGMRGDLARVRHLAPTLGIERRARPA